MRTFGLFFLNAFLGLAAGPSVQSNVVYGMYSGAALLMDVHKPANPNGYGVLFISGSGWTTPLAYSAWQLKENAQSLQYAKPLVAAGFTVFTINHRSLPRFKYPAAIEDAQRAVRFIRHQAKTFGIRPDRIGASGGSSGGHLVSILGTMDGKGNPNDPDPVERESAKVQAVVARAAPTNLVAASNNPFTGIYMPPPPPGGQVDKSSLEYKTLQDASPISYISADDPPFLLMHGTADTTVLPSQSIEFEKALKAAGIPAKLILVDGAGHGPTFPGATKLPDYMGEMVTWLQRHLMEKR